MHELGPLDLPDSILNAPLPHQRLPPGLAPILGALLGFGVSRERLAARLGPLARLHRGGPDQRLAESFNGAAFRAGGQLVFLFFSMHP